MIEPSRPPEDDSSARRHRVVLALGSNIDPDRHMLRAAELLAERGTIVAASQVWETKPVGGCAGTEDVTGQQDYLNAVVVIEGPHDADAWVDRIVPEIEAALGRVRHPDNKYAPRTIDLDLILAGDHIGPVGSGGRRIPDPDIERRAFVAVPLAEALPGGHHPETGVPFTAIAAQFSASELARDMRIRTALSLT